MFAQKRHIEDVCPHKHVESPQKHCEVNRKQKKKVNVNADSVSLLNKLLETLGDEQSCKNADAVSHQVFSTLHLQRCCTHCICDHAVHPHSCHGVVKDRWFHWLSSAPPHHIWIEAKTQYGLE